MPKNKAVCQFFPKLELQMWKLAVGLYEMSSSPGRPNFAQS